MKHKATQVFKYVKGRGGFAITRGVTNTRRSQIKQKKNTSGGVVVAL